MKVDSRRVTRLATAFPVTLTASDARTIHGTVRDVSILGMFVQSKESFPQGTTCEAEFEIEPMKRVGAQCSVVHRYGDGIGLEFNGIENASFEYLRVLVVSQAEDPQACEDEILANMGSLPALY
ncbi:MAG: hypothetical protein AMXMBFR82_05530 [Candidatus Hydrogenedentota bacterium]